MSENSVRWVMRADAVFNLLAGLLLADTTAAIEDENRQLKATLAAIEARPTPDREKIEVPVVPATVREALAEIAARAEAMAERVEEHRVSV